MRAFAACLALAGCAAFPEGALFGISATRFAPPPRGPRVGLAFAEEVPPILLQSASSVLRAPAPGELERIGAGAYEPVRMFAWRDYLENRFDQHLGPLFWPSAGEWAPDFVVEIRQADLSVDFHRRGRAWDHAWTLRFRAALHDQRGRFLRESSGTVIAGEGQPPRIAVDEMIDALARDLLATALPPVPTS